MFVMMQQQHQDNPNQMKESKKQALEMAQQTIKKIAEQMTTMYNNLQAQKGDWRPKQGYG